MEQRDERIVVETERYRIEGNLKLPRDGYRSRMTDYLNSSERDFIALTDVRIEPLDGQRAPQHQPFIALSRHHIVLAVSSTEAQ